jgi:hypothetical protein
MKETDRITELENALRFVLHHEAGSDNGTVVVRLTANEVIYLNNTLLDVYPKRAVSR